ncbi:MAG: glycosyltransferase [Gemmatimonadales bacterium]
MEHFASSALAELPRPADLPADDRPILGFFGLLQSWVDLPLLRRLAERFPECHVVVIGRSMVDLGDLQGLPNLHLLGQKAYRDLPAYCRAFDVGLIPFVLNELTDAVNPIKLREYLSAGLPVVSTAMPEVVALGEVPGLAVVRTHDEFIEACGRFLATRRGPQERRVAANSFAGEGWAGRCLSMVTDAREALGLGR